MTRTARRFSNSGYLHLIERGIGKQTIFESEDDYQHYLCKLEKYSRELDVMICAFCLMNNHVHILVRDQNHRSSVMMKKLGISYSLFFNKKYERCGHLFQDRFLSECIDSERYLLAVFRYILNNPVRAGICPARSYRWSSYNLYDCNDTFVNAAVFHNLIGNRGQLDAFLVETDTDDFLEYNNVKKGDAWAQSVIQECIGVQNGIAIQSFERSNRDQALYQLKLCGLSVRQIARLTGIGRNIVQRA